MKGALVKKAIKFHFLQTAWRVEALLVAGAGIT